jgi:hypothetical protein
MINRFKVKKPFGQKGLDCETDEEILENRER